MINGNVYRSGPKSVDYQTDALNEICLMTNFCGFLFFFFGGGGGRGDEVLRRHDCTLLVSKHEDLVNTAIGHGTKLFTSTIACLLSVSTESTLSTRLVVNRSFS